MADDRYISERERGELPRNQEAIDGRFWGGFIALIGRIITNGYLAESFPAECDDGPFLIGSGDG